MPRPSLKKIRSAPNHRTTAASQPTQPVAMLRLLAQNKFFHSVGDEAVQNVLPHPQLAEKIHPVFRLLKQFWHFDICRRIYVRIYVFVAVDSAAGIILMV